MLLAVAVLRYDTASIKFCKKKKGRREMRNLRDSKSGLPLLELLKIPVTWSNFIISIIFFYYFVVCPYFEKHLDFCTLCML